jgi:hypothetical protein
MRFIPMLPTKTMLASGGDPTFDPPSGQTRLACFAARHPRQSDAFRLYGSLRPIFSLLVDKIWSFGFVLPNNTMYRRLLINTQLIRA